MSYNLNPESARKADQFGGFITEMGAYTGVLTNVYEVISGEKKTKGIVFDFKSDSGQTTEFSIWIQKANGEELFGMNVLNAIMACTSVRNINPTQGTAKLYDKQSNSRIDKPVTILPELIDKRIGIMLETEDYRKNDGSIGTKMVFAMPYRDADLFTAGEILDKAVEPKIYHSRLSSLRHRTLPNAKGSSSNHGGDPRPTPPNDLEDGIPF